MPENIRDEVERVLAEGASVHDAGLVEGICAGVFEEVSLPWRPVGRGEARLGVEEEVSVRVQDCTFRQHSALAQLTLQSCQSLGVFPNSNSELLDVELSRPRPRVRLHAFEDWKRPAERPA